MILLFLHKLRAYDGAAVVRLCLLMIACAFVEGLGLVLLLPLLSLIGLGQYQGLPFIDHLVEFLSSAGVELTLQNLLGIYLVLIAARLFLLRKRDMASAKLRFGFVGFLRKQLWRAIANCEWPYLAKRRSSDFVHVLGTEMQRLVLGTQEVAVFASTLVMIGVYLAVALQVSFALSAIVMGLGAVLFVPLRFFRRNARRLGQNSSYTQRELFAVISELLLAMKSAKSHCAEQAHLQAFDVWNEKYVQSRLSFQETSTNSSSVFQFLGAIVLVALVWGGREIVGLLVTDLLVMVAIFIRLVPFFARLERSSIQLLHMMGAFRLIHETQTACEAHAEPVADAHDPLPEFQQKISFEGVSYSHGQDRPVLQDISFCLPANAMVGIAGVSGAGKSTLVDMIAGLSQPDQGTIKIDQSVLKPVQRRIWRRQIAYVTQESFLLYDTVRANLLWGLRDQEISDDQLYEVLQQASAAEFVKGLPQGLDTKITMGGIGLSVGEKQRLSLARALLRKPKLLILDEATSALDNENAGRILAALHALKGQLSIVIVSHDLSMLKNCDNILVLADGKIVEQGRWDRLKENEKGSFGALLEGGDRRK
ncbi:ABC transporter ATP-binding protein [Terasakiella pusilla]|uniref:ABC transporter ATP-binding protein n=1 Tax=Terasakiella pusilla TaxID=64973 RepID=UPI003AA8CDA0